jgi:transaldolase/glucose-6-phosphate isomerase
MAMSENPLRQLPHHGQSVWLDQLQRDWIASGMLARWMEEDGIRGITSNPSIFEHALQGSASYDAQLRELAASGLSSPEIYDALTLEDIRGACDVFRPLYEETEGAAGFVSHEVSPELAYDTWGTIHEVRRLWAAVDRPNVLIKIPATDEGIPAIQTCLGEGINVNITLMFTLEQYEAVADAYLSALETVFGNGGSITHIASVASFFVSRVDSKVDGILDERRATLVGAGSAAAADLKALRGKAAVANAERAYARFCEKFSGRRFAALDTQGAQRQRVLWASTSTKDPEYSDIKYVESLVGPHTVNTIPLETLEKFRDHGRVGKVLDGTTEEADAVVARLGGLGIDLNEVGQELLKEGVDKFAQAFAGALDVVEESRRRVTS